MIVHESYQGWSKENSLGGQNPSVGSNYKISIKDLYISYISRKNLS